MSDAVRRLIAIAGTLALAGVGVFVALHLRMPLPWMLGPLIATAIASLAGLQIAGRSPALPPQSRDIFVPVLGVVIAARMTPQIVEGLWRWWPSLLAVIPYVVLLQMANYVVFRRLGRYDPATAYFAASPGGLVEATLLGTKSGGSTARIVMHHSTRVIFAMVTVPFVLRFLGYSYDRSSVSKVPFVFGPEALTDFAMVVPLALLGVMVARRLHVPGGPMLGPFLFCGALYGAGIVHAPVPSPLVNLAQLVIGATLGTRFGPTDRNLLLSGLTLSILALISSLLVAGLAAVTLRAAGVADLSVLFLSFAPGGLSEMSLIAVALHADPVFVATHHMVRIVSSVTISPFVFHRFIARDR